jgi:hypothetical protein
VAAKKSAFQYDAQGAYAIQDPDEDLDWYFNFRDPKVGEALEASEQIVSIVEMNLTRDDGQPIGAAEKHDELIIGPANEQVRVFIRNLVLAATPIVYRVECTVQTNSVPPRRISKSFRLICKEN